MMDMLRATSGVSSVLRKVSRAAFDTALDTVLPPQCLACDALVSAPAFGRWLARAGADLVADADWIAPVPLHPLRLWRRRFNQSALLTQALAREADVSEKFAPDLLRRTRAAPTQGGLNASQRRRNVRGAFAVQARHADGLRGRRVLLIDDVYTTGATLEACTRALLKAGAETVDALVLARVDRPR